ncbi:ParB/RepB/Spo0J family partition protein [Ruminococcus sp.]|uniref:ParB/RepB/Spo0J family partition protein n=1 Tax=Ruminococcus sp. TaxID=41978 RepID=UPI0025FDF9E3|nr:ParB/RepB/Spo0J family partition protein [Ruminococcus sp.]MBQ8967352.1 ParB/RepB/Spo0J family partition protein [Ruminococcus sp.]
MAKKNRMGSGLDMLFAENTRPAETAPQQESADSVTMVKITLLEPNKEQPRGKFDDEKLAELADSIKENGVLQPILARPLDNGGYQIVAGERRWRASRLAGLSEVPVYIKELDDRQTMQMALIENIQRQDLSPVEEALAYKNLMDSYDMTQQQLAQAVGKSRSAVANSLRLLELDENVRDMVDKGEISFGHAKVLSGLEKNRQAEFAKKVQQEGLSVRQLEDALKDAERLAEKQLETDRQAIRKRSVKKERPFLKEFEMAVNANSDVKVKAKSDSSGGVRVELKVPKETDAEELLKKLAEILAK